MKDTEELSQNEWAALTECFPQTYWFVASMDWLEGIWPTKIESLRQVVPMRPTAIRRGRGLYEALGGGPGEERRTQYYLMPLQGAERHGFGCMLRLLAQASVDVYLSQGPDDTWFVNCHGLSHTQSGVRGWPRAIAPKTEGGMSYREAVQERRNQVVALARILQQEEKVR